MTRPQSGLRTLAKAVLLPVQGKCKILMDFMRVSHWWVYRNYAAIHNKSLSVIASSVHFSRQQEKIFFKHERLEIVPFVSICFVLRSAEGNVNKRPGIVTWIFEQIWSSVTERDWDWTRLVTCKHPPSLPLQKREGGGRGRYAQAS